MSHCWKSHVTAHFFCHIYLVIFIKVFYFLPYILQSWYDPRLVWNISEYNNISEFDANWVWRPEFFVSNSYVFEIIIQCDIVLLLISDTTTYIVYKCSSTLLSTRQKWKGHNSFEYFQS